MFGDGRHSTWSLLSSPRLPPKQNHSAECTPSSVQSKCPSSPKAICHIETLSREILVVSESALLSFTPKLQVTSCLTKRKENRKGTEHSMIPFLSRQNGPCTYCSHAFLAVIKPSPGSVSAWSKQPEESARQLAHRRRGNQRKRAISSPCQTTRYPGKHVSYPSSIFHYSEKWHAPETGDSAEQQPASGRSLSDTSLRRKSNVVSEELSVAGKVATALRVDFQSIPSTASSAQSAE